MTIREAVLSFSGVQINDASVDLELINADLVGSETYTKAIERDVAYVAYKSLTSLFLLNRFQEGDMSIQFDTGGVMRRLLFLSRRYGFDDLISDEVVDDIPKVRNKSFIW